MVEHAIESFTVEQADQILDEAWQSGGDVAGALAVAKQRSVEIGRDPVIEDAKLLLAEANRCSPSEAFTYLVKISQRTNTKVRFVAHRIVESLGDSTLKA